MAPKIGWRDPIGSLGGMVSAWPLPAGERPAKMLRFALLAVLALPPCGSRRRKFEFVISLKTAKALGLTIPWNVLANADQVVE